MAELKSYLPLHDLCNVRMRSYIPQLVRLQNQEASLDTFSRLIEEFVDCIATITKEPLTDVQLQSTALWDALSGDDQKLKFLEKCITSHLQTCGCSIVVGNTLDEVNKMIGTLAAFLSPSERLRSRYAVARSKFRYESDLFLQGLAVEKGKSANIPETEVIRTQLPSTLIDVSNKEVKQTNQLHKHLAMRNDMLSHELGLYNKRPQQQRTLKPETELDIIQVRDDKGFYSNVFRVTDERSKLVGNFLQEIALLPSACGVCEAYTSQFVRLLLRKALALIKYVEAESPRPRQIALDPASSQEVVKKLKRALSLDEEGDWKIVLATAEKLKPGMFRHVLGDPSEHCLRVEQELANL